MILTYDEALARSANPNWFSSTYKKEEICTDEEVEMINKLVKEVGENYLHDYFCINDDMFLQREYMDDLIDYLNDIKMENVK